MHFKSYTEFGLLYRQLNSISFKSLNDVYFGFRSSDDRHNTKYNMYYIPTILRVFIIIIIYFFIGRYI